MIILITYKDDKTGRQHVSHGVDVDTLHTVTLPPEPLEAFSPKWDSEMMEWFIWS